MGANGEANNEELQALKQEVVIMRDRLEHHPEVKRFAGLRPLAQGLAALGPNAHALLADLVHSHVNASR